MTATQDLAVAVFFLAVAQIIHLILFIMYIQHQRRTQ